MGNIPEHLRYLYEWPNTNNYDDLSDYAFAEQWIYSGDIDGARSFLKLDKREVMKVTHRFVYVDQRIPSTVARDTTRHPLCRLDRAELEAGQGVYHKKLGIFVYTWNDIKDAWFKLNDEWDAYIEKTIARVEAERIEVAATGYRCARCNKQFDRIVSAPWSNDEALSKITHHITQSPYFGKWVCKTCRHAAFDEYRMNYVKVSYS